MAERLLKIRVVEEKKTKQNKEMVTRTMYVKGVVSGSAQVTVGVSLHDGAIQPQRE